MAMLEESYALGAPPDFITCRDFCHVSKTIITPTDDKRM